MQSIFCRKPKELGKLSCMNAGFRRLASLATPFPITLALAHAVLTVVVFRLAIAQPIKSALLPMVVFIADLPCSFVIIYISRALPEIGYTGSLLRDGDAFLLIGRSGGSQSGF